MISTKKDKAPSARVRRMAPKSETSRDRQHRKELGEELVGVCLWALQRFRALPRNRRVFGKLYFPSKAQLARQFLADVDHLSEMFTLWKEDTEYLDEHCEPRVIAISGRSPSFGALCTSQKAMTRKRQLLALALRMGMCKRLGRNRIAHSTDFVRLNGNPTLLLAHTVLNVERLIKTAVFNSRHTREDGLFQRMVWGYLSDKNFASFMDMGRHSLAGFFEQQHRWLMGHSDVLTGKRGKRPSGISAFIFRD